LMPSLYVWRIAYGLMPGLLGADLAAKVAGHGADPLTSLGLHLLPKILRPDLIPDATPPLSSGYMQRAKDVLPKNGSKRPWKLYQNYAKDMFALRFGKVDDGVLIFSKAEQPAKERLRA